MSDSRFSRLGWSPHHAHSTFGATCSCTGKGLSIALTRFLPAFYELNPIWRDGIFAWKIWRNSNKCSVTLANEMCVFPNQVIPDSATQTAWKLHGGFCDGMGENWNFPTCMMSGRESVKSPSQTEAASNRRKNRHRRIFIVGRPTWAVLNGHWKSQQSTFPFAMTFTYHALISDRILKPWWPVALGSPAPSLSNFTMRPFWKFRAHGILLRRNWNSMRKSLQKGLLCLLCWSHNHVPHVHCPWVSKCCSALGAKWHAFVDIPWLFLCFKSSSVGTTGLDHLNP